MTESPRVILDHPSYPKNGTFADLIAWHLEVWGTRPTGPPAIWELRKFREAIFGARADDEERLVYGWLGSGSPPGPENLKQVIKVLFGDDPIFTEWRIDLTQACRDSRGKNGVKNKRSKVSLDQSRSKSTTVNVDEAPQNSLDPLRASQTNHLGADAKHGVKVIADTLAEHYYGRTADLEMVSAFVDARMAGGEAALLIVTAPAGFGKSALAVNWCNSMDSHPSRCVAMHLCSISSGRATTSLDNIFANLHSQIAEKYGVPPQTLRDNDAVTGLLATAPPGDKQLVLWLDGLDEADELLPCFLPQKLGERVCVIVSARAEDKLIPGYVDEWQYSLRAQPHCPHRHPLTKIPQDGIQDLLTGLCSSEGLTPADGLAGRIYNASEQGYPLFARLMADDALEAMKKGEELDLGDAPESLANYVVRQLERLEKLAAWHEYQPLFVFLTIAREAVRIDELPALIGQRLLPKLIPHQIARWFILVAGDMPDGPPMLSIVHPKLTELFGRALGYQRGIAARYLCERMVKTDPAEWPLYAWRHMPIHFLENGMITEAENRLVGIDFIAARMKAVGAVEGPRLFANDFFYWYDITRQDELNTHNRHTLMRHMRLWNNHAVQLQNLAMQGHANVWRQLMHDVEINIDAKLGGLLHPKAELLADSLSTFKGHTSIVSSALAVVDGLGFLSSSCDNTLRLWSASGEAGPILRGHEGTVKGALLLLDGAGFLSWSDDNTLRLWSASGEAGPVLRGHGSKINGALLLPDRAGFLSWSDDNTLRLWSVSGQAGSALVGHEGTVKGALLLPDGAGFLSWSKDDTLRLWSSSGEAGPVLTGHESSIWGINGALLLPDGAGFLSWSDDDTLHLWSSSGEAGPVLTGHENSVEGALLLPDGAGFLSWSSDNTLRLWSASGVTRQVLHGHEGSIKGALLLPDNAGFLSWSFDKTLRLWSASGEAGPVLRGHDSAIFGVEGALLLPDGAGFLSWSHDRTIRLWSASGEPGPVLRGHEMWIQGGLLLPDSASFLSWSADFTLRLWNASTEAGSALHGHEEWVYGAIMLSDDTGFLSWSADFTLRLWNASGEAGPVLHGHEDFVYGALILPDDAGFLSWSKDNTLRLWSTSGEAGPVLRGHKSEINGALLLPNGAGFLSWSEDDTLRLWSTSGEAGPVLSGHRHAVNGALVLLGGAGFLSWSRDATLRLWNTAGEAGPLLHGHEDSVLGAFALADGAGFLSWSSDFTLRLWNASGEAGPVLHGHEDWVNGALILPDDAGFLSWSNDRTLRLWNASGEAGPVLRGHDSPIFGISGALLLSEGAGFLSWSNDHALRLWDKDGKCRYSWLSPNGTISQVYPTNIPDQFLVVFGNNIGLIQVPL